MAFSSYVRQALTNNSINQYEYIASRQREFAYIQEELNFFTTLDVAYTTMFVRSNKMVNFYQHESMCLDCYRRTLLDEDHIEAAANNIDTPDNPLFYKDGYLTDYSFPYILGFGIGKLINGSAISPALTSYCEPNLRTWVLTAINAFKVSNASELIKTFGQTCVENDPLTDADDTFVTNQPVVDAMNELVSKTTYYRNFLTGELKPTMLADSGDTSRDTKTAIAIQRVDTTISNLNTWIGKPNFASKPGSVDTCEEFNALIPSNFDSKGTNTNIAYLENVLNTRRPQVTARQEELYTFLGVGTVTPPGVGTTINPMQNVLITQAGGNASIPEAGGTFKSHKPYDPLINYPLSAWPISKTLYYERAFHANAAVHRNVGTRRTVKRLTISYTLIQPLIDAFTSVISSGFFYTADTRVKCKDDNGNIICVLDTSKFLVGDSVYISSDKYLGNEVFATITDITTRYVPLLQKSVPIVVLNNNVPADITCGLNSRLFKIINNANLP
jgi:hypothetical protein